MKIYGKFPEPLQTMIDKAGGIDVLRSMLGNVPARTFYRWASTVRSLGTEALPRSAKAAIKQAQEALQNRSTD